MTQLEFDFSEELVVIRGESGGVVKLGWSAEWWVYDSHEKPVAIFSMSPNLTPQPLGQGINSTQPKHIRERLWAHGLVEANAKMICKFGQNPLVDFGELRVVMWGNSKAFSELLEINPDCKGLF